MTTPVVDTNKTISSISDEIYILETTQIVVYCRKSDNPFGYYRLEVGKGEKNKKQPENRKR